MLFVLGLSWLPVAVRVISHIELHLLPPPLEIAFSVGVCRTILIIQTYPELKSGPLLMLLQSSPPGHYADSAEMTGNAGTAFEHNDTVCAFPPQNIDSRNCCAK